MSDQLLTELAKVRTPDEARSALGSIITRFNQASDRLSERHAQLHAEILALRERLRLKDEELARVARLSTMGSMAAALAHEVRNPLGAIRLFVSLLREDLAQAPASLKLVDQIERGISNLDRVVSNMLQFAADRPASRTPVRAVAVAKELSRAVEAEFPSTRITVEGDIQSTVLFDETALRQILTNLWRNAAQAMKGSGDVKTQISGHADEWSIVVQDNGPGIPEKLQASLFEPFVSGRNEGTGLGLAIVKRLVEQHSGTISVRNTAHGACFEIVFTSGCTRAGQNGI